MTTCIFSAHSPTAHVVIVVAGTTSCRVDRFVAALRRRGYTLDATTATAYHAHPGPEHETITETVWARYKVRTRSSDPLPSDHTFVQPTGNPTGVML